MEGPVDVDNLPAVHVENRNEVLIGMSLGIAEAVLAGKPSAPKDERRGDHGDAVERKGSIVGSALSSAIAHPSRCSTHQPQSAQA